MKIVGRNISNLRYADDTTLMAESKEELKGLLMKVKRESEETGLTFKTLRSWHPVHHFMANRRGQSGEAVTDFILGGSKITMDCGYSHEFKDACSMEGKL